VKLSVPPGRREFYHGLLAAVRRVRSARRTRVGARPVQLGLGLPR